MVLTGAAADTLLGKPVVSAKNEDMGRIVDIIMDRAGNIRAAIIDFGGFLGVGTRKIAVDWRVLHFEQDAGKLRLVSDLPRAELQAAPAYRTGEAVVIMGRADSAPAAVPPAPAPQASVAPAQSPAPSQPPAATDPAPAAQPAETAAPTSKPQ